MPGMSQPSNTPIRSWSQQQSQSSDPSQTNHFVAFYQETNQQLSNIPDTIISLQYDPDEFISFRVCMAQQGKIVKLDNQAIGITCQIAGKTYTFNREHLDILMSDRERRELFNYLGVDSSQFFRN